MLDASAIPAANVIFTAKTGLDVFSNRREHVWTCSVLGDCICGQDSRGSEPEISEMT